MAEWTDYLESMIITIIKKRFPEKASKQLKDVNFTTSEESLDGPDFPNAYVHLLPMAEIGQDLEGSEINAVLATFQVNVATNKTREEAKAIANVIVSLFKELRFSIIAFPEVTTRKGVHYCVFRARRPIGSSDIL